MSPMYKSSPLAFEPSVSTAEWTILPTETVLVFAVARCA
jgi:hypothetical protein